MPLIHKFGHYIYYTVLGTLNAKRKDLIRWFLDTIVHKKSPCLLSEPDEDYAKRTKVAVVCIAKDEDHYIDEWITYHLGLGVDDIFIYQNNWRYAGPDNGHIHLVEFDGETKQLDAYNDFIEKHWNEFDFAVFIDIDEFICLVADPNIKVFLSRYREHHALALNWRYFGNNGLSTVERGCYSVLKRFTKCGRELNRHVKTIVNLHKCKGKATFVNPHYVNEALHANFTIAVDGKSHVHESFLYRHDKELAWINHYYCKTFEEFITCKKRRGRADIPQGKNVYPIREFHPCNQNDVENTIARDRFLQMENASRI